MEVEKKRSKGGFFGLFDWHGMSRKKLFANSELKEGQYRGKEPTENFTQSRLQLPSEVDRFGANLSHRRSNDFSSASSVISDEECGNRAPGVVARLMGLDSLPTSQTTEPYSTPYFESRSLKASHYDRSTPNLQSDYHPMDYLTVPHGQGGMFGNPTKSRVQKVQNRPIERFQTEMLPPKSAKPISITHHKLLSPIKSPGFIPTNDAAYIMEAAAKIIDPSPQATKINKVPSVGLSSVPLRIRDLKEKMEAVHRASKAQTTMESVANKRKPCDKSHCASEYAPSYKALTNLQKASPENLRVKGKSASLAAQAKANIQRREGSSSSSKKISMNREKNEVKSNQSLKNDPGMRKAEQKRALVNKESTVLKQNNQKQNSTSNKEKSVSKVSVSAQQSRKSHSMNGSCSTTKVVKKVTINPETGPRKAGLVQTNTGKESSFPKQKSSSRKQRSVTGDVQSRESAANKVLTGKIEKSIKSDNPVGSGRSNKLSNNDKNEGTDIVSFTFTSPIKRSNAGSQSSGRVKEQSKNLVIDSSADNGQSYIKSSGLSSSGLNTIDGDSLSVLLEQKLKELASKIESSKCNLGDAESCVTSASTSSTTEISMSISHVGSNSSVEHSSIEAFQCVLPRDNSDNCDYDCSPKLQESKEIKECSTSSTGGKTGKELNYWHRIPVSNHCPSDMFGDCSDNNDIIEGDEQSSSVHAQEDSSCPSKSESLITEGETELSDTASSFSVIDGVRISRTYSLSNAKGSCNWELEYVRDILSKTELTLEDLALGQQPLKVINPELFYQFEGPEDGKERYGGEYSKVKKKFLFDSICECLETRCRRISIGSCKACNKCSTLLQKRKWLAEELWKEISGWKSMVDLMVDELVDKDMSTQYGRWLDFDLEALEEGVEIEQEILTGLVDELVADLHC